MKNSADAQSMNLEVPAVPIWLCRPGRLLKSCWSSVCIGSLKSLVLVSVRECSFWSKRVNKLARKSEDKQAEINYSILVSVSFHLDCHQKVLYTLTVDLSISNNVIKKILQRCACQLSI